MTLLLSVVPVILEIDRLLLAIRIHRIAATSVALIHCQTDRRENHDSYEQLTEGSH